jgi:hypothetical protein
MASARRRWGASGLAKFPGVFFNVMTSGLVERCLVIATNRDGVVHIADYEIDAIRGSGVWVSQCC